MSTSELKDLLELLQESGVTSYKTPDLELQLRPRLSETMTVPVSRDVQTEEIFQSINAGLDRLPPNYRKLVSR